MGILNDSHREFLVEKGLRVTHAREEILYLIDKHRGPICAVEILKKLKEKGLAINKTTVYRALDVFLENDLIIETGINAEVSYYETTNKLHHHHAVCDNCGFIKKVEDRFLERGVKRLEESLTKDFRIRTHKMTFYGICAGCQRK